MFCEELGRHCQGEQIVTMVYVKRAPRPRDEHSLFQCFYKRCRRSYEYVQKASVPVCVHTHQHTLTFTWRTIPRQRSQCIMLLRIFLDSPSSGQFSIKFK